MEISTNPEQNCASFSRALQVRVRVDASCAGGACNGLSGAKDAEASEWCEVLLAQHVPQGAYIDVDEVKVRAIARGLRALAALFGLALRLAFAGNKVSLLGSSATHVSPRLSSTNLALNATVSKFMVAEEVA